MGRGIGRHGLFWLAYHLAEQISNYVEQNVVLIHAETDAANVFWCVIGLRVYVAVLLSLLEYPGADES